MNKKTFTTIALLILIAGTIGAYLYFLQHDQKQPSTEKVVQIETTPPKKIESAKPKTRQVLNAPETEVEIPDTTSSDTFASNALAKLLSNKALMHIFKTDQLIHNIVVTVDNLPREHVSMRVMPIKKLSGEFITITSDSKTYISSENHARYSKYVAFAEAINPQEIVELYLALYPLFQAEYEALGYPGQYFNDRLITMIDHLLATPDIAAPIELIRPKYYYRYADQALEDRSIGQRLLIRIGSDNASIVIEKLRAIKEVLLQHMHEDTIE